MKTLVNMEATDLQAVLLFFLSVVAGTTDIIGFLGLNGLFTAHITGNLVLLCARVVGTGDAQIAPILSIPVFVLITCLTRVLAGKLEAKGIDTLTPLLCLQFALITGFLACCVASGPRIDPAAAIGIFAGMLGVSAMAVQNALVQISLKDAPSTAIMTSNVTRFALDMGTVMLGANKEDLVKARSRAGRTLPVILGFAIGCGIGGVLVQSHGLVSLFLPASLALGCVALGYALQRVSRIDN